MNENRFIAVFRDIRDSLRRLSRRDWIVCAAVFPSVGFLCALYILFRPGNYIEPGTLGPLFFFGILYAALLSGALIRRGAWGRVVFFAFSPGSSALRMAEFLSD